MERPKAKTELLVRTVTSLHDTKPIYLSYSSAEAERWIQHEAPHFGMLLPHKDRSYRLMIDVGMWDAQEVAEYLRSYVDIEKEANRLLEQVLGGERASQ